MLEFREDYVNRTENTWFGDSGDWQEAWTDDRGKLYRSCMAEYGRCTGKICTDASYPEGVGWVFLKRMTYEDARKPYDERDYYLREVRVHVRER